MKKFLQFFGFPQSSDLIMDMYGKHRKDAISHRANSFIIQQSQKQLQCLQETTRHSSISCSLPSSVMSLNQKKSYNWSASLKLYCLSQLGVKSDYKYYLASNLRFFPLRFLDKSIEKKYFHLNERLYPMRMLLLGIGCIIINIFIWVYISTRLSILSQYHGKEETHFPIFISSQRYLFHSVQGFLCTCYILLCFSPTCPFLYKNLELTTYCLLSLCAIGTSIFSIYGIMHIPNIATSSSGGLQLNILSEAIVAETEFKEWSNCLLEICSLGMTISVDVFLPTRTRFSIFFHGLIFIVYSIPHIISLHFLSSTYRNLPITQLEIWTLISFVILAYIGRYMMELSERASAYEIIHNIDRLLLLEKKLENSTNHTKSSTAVEDLIVIIKESMTCLINAKLGHIEDFSKTEDLMTTALRILTRTDDLFTVRFSSTTGPDHDMNQHFIELYAGQHDKQMKYPNLKGRIRLLGEDTTFSDMTPTPRSILQRKRRDSDYSVATSHSDKTNGFEYLNRQYNEQVNLLLGIKNIEVIPSRQLPSHIIQSLGYDWSLNLISMGEQTSMPLYEVGSALLEHYIDYLQITPNLLYKFLINLEKMYLPNPYHNSLHAAAVAHMTAVLCHYIGLCSSTTILEDADMISVLIAALSHDVGHPGKNNAFFINTYNPLSILYNDRSPLENLHSCLLFRLLDKESTNIFSSFDDELYRHCRKNIINIILTTDMKQHFEAISLFRVRRSSPDFDCYNNKDDLWQTLHMIVKTADLGHTSADWDQHQTWSAWVVEEFYQQGEEEIRLGYPISPLCDRSKHSDYAKSQKGFIEFVVQPLFEEIVQLDASGRIEIECVRRLNLNRASWDSISKNELLIKQSQHHHVLIHDTSQQSLCDITDLSKDILDRLIDITKNASEPVNPMENKSISDSYEDHIGRMKSKDICPLQSDCEQNVLLIKKSHSHLIQQDKTVGSYIYNQHIVKYQLPPPLTIQSNLITNPFPVNIECPLSCESRVSSQTSDKECIISLDIF